jgi:hypothetical protein
MTKLLDSALRRLQSLPEEKQDAIAAIILEELEEQAEIAEYDRSKAEAEIGVPFEDAVRDIERNRSMSRPGTTE